jgi:PKD repeat protein
MRSTLFSLILSMLSTFACSQIPNPGMENWTSEPTLIGWQTNSHPLTLPPYDPYIVRKDTHAFSGNYAANLYANGVFKAIAKTTFPITQIPQNLSLWKMVSFPPCVNEIGYPDKDTVSVLVEILYNGAVVDLGYWETSIGNFSYEQLMIPISQNASLADSCRITMQGGRVWGGCGFAPAATEFRTDALSLNNSPSGCVDSSQINTNVFCNAIYDPVCGCNGITYSNSCIAENYGGVTGWQPGECTTTGGLCGVSFYHSKNTDTVNFTNQSTAASISNYLWSFGDDSSSQEASPQHIYKNSGWYEVCLYITGTDSTGANCIASHCDSIYVSDGCIDSSLICPPGSLCCDAPLYMPVCGCDGVTYMNACTAALFGGVISSTPGSCDSISSGLGQPGKDVTLRISPNPAVDKVSIQFYSTQETELHLEVKNSVGEVLISQIEWSTANGYKVASLDLSALSAGLYFIDARTTREAYVTKKLIKL